MPYGQPDSQNSDAHEYPRTHHRVSRITPEARTIIPGQNPSPIPVYAVAKKS
jgi:hypothetical protein